MALTAVNHPINHVDPESILILDPSELYRPEIKKMEDFREYSDEKDDPIQQRVRETYRKMHTHQTVDFVKNKVTQWTKFNRARMTIMEALETLNCLVDESDPDVDIPNSVHAFQTAERIREAHPDLDWFHLTGLIHDLGKVMALHGEPQWSVVGDTYPVGCEFAPSIVYRNTSFVDNPDLYNPKFNTKLGIYEENCGLENIIMSWGHDEYMYRVLKHNKSKLPEEALYMIRFHSFYPWHLNEDYSYLASNKDNEMKKWVKEFNKFDLYSKSHIVPDIDALMPYYQSLVDKYIPGVLECSLLLKAGIRRDTNVFVRSVKTVTFPHLINIMHSMEYLKTKIDNFSSDSKNHTFFNLILKKIEPDFLRDSVRKQVNENFASLSESTRQYFKYYIINNAALKALEEEEIQKTETMATPCKTSLKESDVKNIELFYLNLMKTYLHPDKSSSDLKFFEIIRTFLPGVLENKRQQQPEFPKLLTKLVESNITEFCVKLTEYSMKSKLPFSLFRLKKIV
ncbi:inositol oxygenase [Trichonephila clavata]|uniref:Inositol oxygenase n=1 Tax=Trichonephila clavata TaxID=2740835 RepID=A0A8X6F4G6_TRICU|nr:inositol oxygenase [Trichonephila clavata]